MSNSSPLNQQPSPKPDSRQLDEWIAVIVALLSIGSIFFWVMLRDNSGFTLKSPEIFVSSTQPSESSEPSKIIEVKPTTEEDQKSSIQRNDAEKLEKSSFLPAKSQSSETDKNSLLSSLVALPIIALNSTAPVTETPTPTPLSSTPLTATPETSATIEPTESKPTETAATTTEEAAANSQKTESKPTETAATTTEEAAANSQKTESKPTETAATTTEETAASTEPTESKPTETAATTTPVKFSDVADNYWARPAIESLTSRNIVNGFPDGSFRPDTPVTRAELAMQLQQVFAQPTNQQTGVNYKDIPKDSAVASAINQVAQSGFLRGYPGDIFRPDQQIPRVQVLVAIASGLNLELPDKPEQLLKQYKDAADIPNYAIAKVAAATQKGLVVNYPDRKLLNPNQPATRAEVSAMIYQALAISGEVEPLSNPYVVKP